MMGSSKYEFNENQLDIDIAHNEAKLIDLELDIYDMIFNNKQGYIPKVAFNNILCIIRSINEKHKLL